MAKVRYLTVGSVRARNEYEKLIDKCDPCSDEFLICYELYHELHSAAQALAEGKALPRPWQRYESKRFGVLPVFRSRKSPFVIYTAMEVAVPATAEQRERIDVVVVAICFGEMPRYRSAIFWHEQWINTRSRLEMAGL